jgi:hypothetical protein
MPGSVPAWCCRVERVRGVDLVGVLVVLCGNTWASAAATPPERPSVGTAEVAAGAANCPFTVLPTSVQICAAAPQGGIVAGHAAIGMGVN